MTQTPSGRADEEEPGDLDLAAAVRRRTKLALDRGALVPLVTERHVLLDRGVPFLVHVLDPAARRKQRAAGAKGGAERNPFLPYEEDLFVAELTPTHVALLNKFNVLEHHLLIVTREYEEQETLLTEADFAAVARCLDAIDGLAFYNSGTAAGASQSHRHLQIVPRRASGGADPFPLLSRLEQTAAPDGRSEAGLLPFRHRLVDLEPGVIRSRPAEMARIYRRLLAELDLVGSARRPAAPYNLLATRSLLLLVPRSRERWCEVSINALAFAGSLLLGGGHALEEVRREGPFRILRAVAA